MDLKELRIKNKLTRKEVAQQTDTSEVYILLLETAKRNPSDKMKEKLAKVYNVDLITIFSALKQTKCYIKEEV